MKTATDRKIEALERRAKQHISKLPPLIHELPESAVEEVVQYVENAIESARRANGKEKTA